MKSAKENGVNRRSIESCSGLSAVEANGHTFTSVKAVLVKELEEKQKSAEV